MAETQDKQLAIEVIRRLWPAVKIVESNVTPDVADYVFRVFAAAKGGHKLVKSLAPSLGLATSWAGIGLKLAMAARGYLSEKQDWGMAIRAAVDSHRRHVQAAMTYGTDVYPLQFDW